MTVKVQDISQEEVLAHKLALVGRILQMGFEQATKHMYGYDLAYMKEIEFEDPRKVMNDLHDELVSL